MRVQQFYPIYQKHPEICIDSREARPGSIFLAIKGDSFDGNDFVNEALEGGCNRAIVDNPRAHKKERTILVDDSLIFLQELASYHRSQLDIPVLGLTGTNGKTTTKELIVAVLSTRYKVIATIGNLNNHIGVPLTVLRANEQTEILVVEMGANHEGEIKFLCDIARPDFGLITNIGRAHLEGFGSFEGVIRAKKELYDFLIANEGSIFLNQQDELLSELLGAYPNIPYGNGPKSFPQSSIIQNFILGFEFDLNAVGISERLLIHTQLVGNYNLSNALAALSVGNHFGISWEFAANAISEYSPEMNRSEYRITDRNKLVLDAYNANPNSMLLSINNFESLQEGNKLAILGDMRELGEFAARYHSEILEMALEKDFDLILVGDEFFKIAPMYSVKAYRTVEELQLELQKHQVKGKSILIKGSNGIHLEKLIPML